MDTRQIIPNRQFLFGSLLILANKIDTLLERKLKSFDITSRQWLLAVVIDNLFDSPPTLMQVAKEMEISHQTVKQVALKLQDKGLVTLLKDKKDLRTTHLQITAGSQTFWDTMTPQGNQFIASLFANLTEEQLTSLRKGIEQLFANLSLMESKE